MAVDKRPDSVKVSRQSRPVSSITGGRKHRKKKRPASTGAKKAKRPESGQPLSDEGVKSGQKPPSKKKGKRRRKGKEPEAAKKLTSVKKAEDTAATAEGAQGENRGQAGQEVRMEFGVDHEEEGDLETFASDLLTDTLADALKGIVKYLHCQCVVDTAFSPQVRLKPRPPLQLTRLTRRKEGRH